MITPAPRRAARGLVQALRALFLAALALTTLAYGSATRMAADLVTLAFAAICCAALAEPLANRRVRAVRTAALTMACVLAGYAWLQTWPLSPEAAAAAWRPLREILGAGPAYISVAPGMTREALPPLLAPFLVFAAALSVFQGDEGGLALWRALSRFGIALAAFGIAQELIFPQTLLLETKRHYLGSLTASFVNRNTAGALFGVALTLNVALLFDAPGRLSLAGAARRARAAAVAAQAAACTITAVALFLTQSRGAVGASLAAVAFETALLASRPLRARPRQRRMVAVAAAAAAAPVLFGLFAGRALYRMQEGGVDAGRWCAFNSTWRAIRDHFPYGAGFAAFQEVFPAYRRAECAGVFGVWERAHNVYLEATLGLGLVFVVVFALGLIALAAVLAYGARVRRRRRYAPAGGLAALALALLQGLVDFSLQIPGFNAYFCAVMAAAVTVSLGRNRMFAEHGGSVQTSAPASAGALAPPLTTRA